MKLDTTIVIRFFFTFVLIVLNNMGAYLSEPITDKVSTDEVGKRVICGASSMQGWRVTQEDAHNCTLEYDTDTSFFAVYDGHGGHEVAAYSAQHLPDHLKKCEAYKKGDYTQALRDAFLEFDATLTTPEVVAVLKQIANNKDGDQNSASDEEEENVKNLYEEAEMPLEQVMAKYQHDHLNAVAKKIKEDCNSPVSPFLRGRRLCTPGASSSKYGTDTLLGSGNGSTGFDEEDEVEGDTEVSSSSTQHQCSSSSGDSRQHLGNSEADQTSGCSTSNGETKSGPGASEELKTKHKAAMPDSSGDSKLQNADKTADQSGDENSPFKVSEAGDLKQEVNGEIGEGDKRDAEQATRDCEGVTSSSAATAHENGEVVELENKGKCTSKASSSCDSNKEKKKNFALRYHTTTALYHSLLRGKDQCDSDTDDDGDESFQGADNSTDDEDGDGADDDDDDDEEEEEEEDEEGLTEEEDNEDDDDCSMLDDEKDDDDDDFTMKMTEGPGSDSGCTAVVALLKGQELYVANSGDSRCVVCRKGKAIEMSLDHKPEDNAEKKRIVNAGGMVTKDGRVNGGLNLSRALGDHAYKQSEGLPAEEQMITALPDVRTLMIDPEQDEFMVLACDGIWNFMSSQEVVDFVRPRIQGGQTKLSQICEELFDHCLAPNTLSDGTGCDNMTAVIVQFRPELVNKSESKSVKRAAPPAIETISEPTKRPKTEEPATCV
ncbi:probable protein phosphatase CG10417 isoform X2 [Zootermopsis nevadensis]|uniref:probable protein phosphatase CG10417 isoform X2 n=1 Tax=Zootermopsis nevadensis TaxID=136037 RepID=UPI000B8E6953|nr:probable protein phosphatase CG10417 isoform X2 [Zootermopsis nevadensis]